MVIREDATIFGWDADPAAVAAARERGEPVVVLPAPHWTRPVPLLPWVVAAGRQARPYGVYVYEASPSGLTLGASNGSLGGLPLVRVSRYIHREDVERRSSDVIEYAARHIRELVDAGYREERL